jgi:hypothetical protein
MHAAVSIVPAAPVSLRPYDREESAGRVLHEKTKEEINLKGKTGCPEKEEESKPVRETQYPEQNENDNSRQARPLVTRTNGGRTFKMAIG